MRNFFIVIISVATHIASAHWSYKGKHDDSVGYNSSHEWPGECAHGKQQSPIDLSHSLAEKHYDMEHLIFTYYDIPPEVEKMTNNGHSVTFTIEDTHVFPKVSGGGLPGEFQFSQFHFHWGSEDRQGSEHTIDGTRAPMEMHLVHFNTKYGSDIKEAISNSNHAWDTLAVLGVMFQVQEEDNHNFDHIVEELKFVRYLDQEVSNVTVFPLMKVLPSNTDNFYRYNGSLTTPPCTEIVIWSIFKSPVSISEDQLNEFRGIFDVEPDSTYLEPESDNFRETQPLNQRKFYEVFTNGVSKLVLPTSTVLPLAVLWMILRYSVL